jgi:hypothetical protein
MECGLLYQTANLLFLALVGYYVQSYSVHKLRYFVPKRVDKLRDNRPNISMPRERIIKLRRHQRQMCIF